jgi:hypothetical protein
MKSNVVTEEVYTSSSWGGYVFLLLLALFWSQQVFQNTNHVVVAGVVSTWWFVPSEASSCCSVATKDSFVRATTSSFGSICFGSLLVAIIQTLPQRNRACKKGWLSCVTNFCLGSLKAVTSATAPSVVCRSHLIHKNLD